MSEDRGCVIVTGSSGLLGRSVCERLANRGYQVFGFDRVGPPEPPKSLPNVHDIECDVTDYASVRGATEKAHRMSSGKLASCVHAAAYYDFSGEDSPLYEKVTINGTDRLLNALQDFEVEQFIFTSTMLVHRPCEVGSHLREDDPLEAKWPYPRSKIETERLIRDGHPGVRSVLLRIAGVYTDFGKQPTMVQQMKRIHEKDFESYFYPGNPSAGQSMVHIDDTVRSIVATVERRKEIEPKTAILIGERDPMSYEELQDEIGVGLYGDEWSTIQIPKAVAKVGATVNETLSGGESFIKPFMVDMADDHYALDTTRASDLLGWQPEHNIRQVLPGIVERLKNDPDRWYEQNGLEPE